MRIRLTNDQPWLTACPIRLTVAPPGQFNKTLYLRAEFENPLSPSSPLITDAKLEPGTREIAIRWGSARSEKGARYSIRIHIFDRPERQKRSAFHDQMMPARLNVNSDGSVSF